MSLVATSVSTYFLLQLCYNQFLVANFVLLFIIKSLASNLDHSWKNVQTQSVLFLIFCVCANPVFQFCCGNSHLMDEQIPCKLQWSRSTGVARHAFHWCFHYRSHPATGCFFRKVPPRKVLSMELVPLNRKNQKLRRGNRAQRLAFCGRLSCSYTH